MNDTTLFALGDCKFQALFIVRFCVFSSVIINAFKFSVFFLFVFLIELLLILANRSGQKGGILKCKV